LNTFKHISGFTLIETAATLMVLSLITVGLIGISGFLLDKQQVDSTNAGLQQLRRAITGDALIVSNEGRTSFGYLGDMGNVPATLQDLWVKGSQPAFTFNTTKKAGAGWNGPYVDVMPAEFASVMTQDGWGNSLSYINTPFFDSSFGAIVFAKLVSAGPDYTAGNSDDLILNFFQSEALSRVQGFVRDTEGTAVSGVGLTLNYPDNGALATQTATSSAAGFYSFTDIPFGNRSITVQPQLVLAPGTTVVSGTGNRDLSFTVRNYSSASVQVASLSVAYTNSPNAWFTQVIVGPTTVYNSTSPRFGTGDSVSFTAQDVNGTGTPEESIPIRLQSSITDVDDLVIGKIGAGGSLVIQLKEFRDAETGGGGNNVDVTGVHFEVTLRNGSNAVIGTVVVSP
jgi:hypothetical protein